jgi:hypothetical protein
MEAAALRGGRVVLPKRFWIFRWKSSEIMAEIVSIPRNFLDLLPQKPYQRIMELQRNTLLPKCDLILVELGRGVGRDRVNLDRTNTKQQQTFCHHLFAFHLLPLSLTPIRH